MHKLTEILLDAAKEALEAGQDGDWQSARKALASAIELAEKQIERDKNDPSKHIVRGRTVDDWVFAGYRLCNYKPGKISIHRPAPYGGLFCDIEGDVADKLGAIYDSHNYNVYRNRKSK